MNDFKSNGIRLSAIPRSTIHLGVAIPGGVLRRKLKRKLKEFQLSDLLNWRENGSDVEKAFNLGEPPLVPISSYPPAYLTNHSSQCQQSWRFLMNPLCPDSVHKDWQAHHALMKWAGNNQRTIK